MLNSLKSRVRKLEKKEPRSVIFIVKNGKASGHAQWKEGLEWKDLSRREYEALKAELEAEDVSVQELHIVKASSQKPDAWEEVSE